MTTLAEFMIIPGADNRPPMLEKFLYDSWKSGMEFYMENTENGIIILDSVQNGPLVWLTITEEDGTTRKKTYAGLSASEKLQADCDCKATNIVLQGLAIPVFNQVDDPNSCLNKAMAFLTTVASSRSHGEAMHGLRKRQYVISEVPHFEPYHTDMDNQSVHAMQGFEQTPVADFINNEVTSDSNIIPYSQYLQETQQAVVQDTNLYAQQDSMILSVIEQMKLFNSMRENDKKEKVKQEMDENETINIELEHSVAKLLSENERLHKEIEHLKKIYKDQFDSIKKTRALSKEHGDSLASSLNCHVFTEVGFKWKPTGRTFTIVGNSCPLLASLQLT
ncbi:hypothetical protein Tco_0532491 [Tanacetum coccineum]